MNRDNLQSKRWNELIDRYLIGDISKEDFELLSAELEQNPNLREQFLRSVQIDYVFHEESSRDHSESAEPPASIRTKILWGFLGAAAALITYFSIISITETRFENETENTSLTISDSEGRLGKVGVIASTSEDEFITDPTLYIGEFQAQKGLFELNLNSGVVVIAQAPVHLDIRDPMEIFCHQGNLRFRVPAQAKGFRVITHDREIIDHGTEFGVNISHTTSSVKVFEGEVEIVQATSDPLRMFEGDIENWGDKPTRAASYPDISQLNRHSFQIPNDWKALLSKTNQDPTLRLLYDFEASGPWKRTIPNKASDAPPETDGAVVGCRSVSGRWPGTYAIEFKKGTDCITIQEPRVYENLTMIAWLHLDGIDRKYNSILTTEDWDNTLGGIDWGYFHGGRQIFHVKHAVWSDSHLPSLTKDLMDQWICIALTYSKKHKLVRHFLNGKMREQTSSSHLLKSGTGTLPKEENYEI